jgi:predicted transcriptional regulator
MSTVDLKERLISKIQEIENEDSLAEACRLLGMEPEIEEPFKLNADQKTAISEARAQIKRGEFLNDQEANNEIDEWLKM